MVSHNTKLLIYAEENRADEHGLITLGLFQGYLCELARLRAGYMRSSI